MIVGAAFVLVFGGLAVMVTRLTGAASLEMGALAEVWTASELRLLRRHGWRIANHILLRFGDIDHLLVGQHGVLVVETKWSANAWNPHADRFRNALRQVQRNAHDIRIWRPELRRGSPDLVRPVLFLWGGSRSDAPRPDSPGFCEGEEEDYGIAAARRWREGLAQRREGGELSEVQVASIWEAVKKNASGLDKREQLKPAPPSIARICVIVMSAFLTATVALLACFHSSQVVTSGWSRVAIAAAYVVAGLLARRWQPARMIALGWLTGTGFAIVITFAVTLVR
jgi:hypothetical protein